MHEPAGTIAREIGAHVTRAITQDPWFSKDRYAENEAEPGPVFFFRHVGDQIAGQLIAGPIANVRRNAHYILRVEPGHPLVQGRPKPNVRIYGNKQIHQIIEQNPQIMGKRILIRFIGHRGQKWGGYAAKVYRIFLLKPAAGWKEDRSEL